jgi:hypothetical protein
MLRQIRGRGDDLGDARLVVGAEQRRARRGDDVVPMQLASSGMSLLAEDGGRIVRQHEVAAVVVRDARSA